MIPIGSASIILKATYTMNASPGASDTIVGSAHVWSIHCIMLHLHSKAKVLIALTLSSFHDRGRTGSYHQLFQYLPKDPCDRLAHGWISDMGCGMSFWQLHGFVCKSHRYWKSLTQRLKQSSSTPRIGQRLQWQWWMWCMLFLGSLHMLRS